MIYLAIYLVIIAIVVLLQQRTINKQRKIIESNRKAFDEFTQKQHKLNKEVLKAAQHILDEHNYMKQSDIL